MAKAKDETWTKNTRSLFLVLSFLVHLSADMMEPDHTAFPNSPQKGALLFHILSRTPVKMQRNPAVSIQQIAYAGSQS